MGRSYGYARVSTDEQSADVQVDELRRAGCDEVIVDEGVSGATSSRPGLDRLVATLEPDDTVTVVRLDRLGRSAAHLALLLRDLVAKNVHIRSLAEGMDTRTPLGRAMYHVASAFAELERETIHERVKAGIRAAQAKGVHCGRPPKLSTDAIMDARMLLGAGRSPADVARRLGVARSTLYAALAADDARQAAADHLPPPRRGRGRPRKVKSTTDV